MLRIDGRKIAERIVARLAREQKPKKFLAAFLAGDDPASASFLKQKEKAARALGVDFRLYRFPESVKNDELRRTIGAIARSAACGGALVQLPLPARLNRRYILNAVPIGKDIDVLSERAREARAAERIRIEPPPVGVLLEVLAEAGHTLTPETKVVVLGRGYLVGEPIIAYLKNKVKLAVIDKGDDAAPIGEADLVVCGAGSPGILKPKILKNGAGVIDFGYGIGADGKPAGDFDASSLEEMRDANERKDGGFYTPTPGGTGPILVAKLIENFFACASNAKRDQSVQPTPGDPQVTPSVGAN